VNLLKKHVLFIPAEAGIKKKALESRNGRTTRTAPSSLDPFSSGKSHVPRNKKDYSSIEKP
jgi:hypothetical protein